MDQYPEGPNFLLIVIAPILCCGVPLLLVAGVASGIGAWLADGGWVTVLIAVVAGVGAVLLWRRRPRSEKSGHNNSSRDKRLENACHVIGPQIRELRRPNRDGAKSQHE